jgi:hypothetical protein
MLPIQPTQPQFREISPSFLIVGDLDKSLLAATRRAWLPLSIIGRFVNYTFHMTSGTDGVTTAASGWPSALPFIFQPTYPADYIPPATNNSGKETTHLPFTHHALLPEGI